MKTCIIGSITHDLFLHYNRSLVNTANCQTDSSCVVFPQGAKIEVTDIKQSIGGGAANVSVACARLGEDVSIVGLCNVLEHADIQKQLEREGVTAAFLHASDVYQTGMSCIIPTHDGDRLVFTYPGANAQLEHSHIPFMICQQYDLLYVAPLHGASEKLLPGIVACAREHALLSAVNPSLDQLTRGFDTFNQACADIDILILNASEAQELMANLLQEYPEVHADLRATVRTVAADMPTLLQKFVAYQADLFTLYDFAFLMQGRGPRTIVVTNGKEGVYVIADMSIYFHASKVVPVVCTLGAGDAFGSTFVISIMRGKTVSEALVAGILQASHVITQYGAQEGLVAGDVLESQIASVGTSGVKRYPL